MPKNQIQEKIEEKGNMPDIPGQPQKYKIKIDLDKLDFS